MFESDTISLYKELDLYTFFVAKEDLKEPFIEEVEGGTIYNYSPKKDALITVFKYQGNRWIEIENVKIPLDKSIRSFGKNYVSQIAREKIAIGKE